MKPPPREPAAAPLHVLVVDDSAVVRQAMTALLSRQPGVTVAVASDPLIALEKMKAARPGVIVLDLELPRMDGLTFLGRLMREDPVPVVVCSSAAGQGTEAALRALEEGALEVIAKPKLGTRQFLLESETLLLDAIRGAASARLPPRGRASPSAASAPAKLGPLEVTTDKVVAVGASTGGTEALRELLAALPADAPGIAIVQHMPEAFTAAFARRLDGLCALEVREARDGDRVLQGRALVAPGNRHLRVRRSGAHYRVEVGDGSLVSRHRPSVDVLFRSVAEAAGVNAVGVILTGMGEDGAEGLLQMRRAGARTVAQDEASCAVFGMPKAAIARGAAEEIVPLKLVAHTVMRLARPGEGR